MAKRWLPSSKFDRDVKIKLETMPMEVCRAFMWLNAGSKVRSFDRDIKGKLKIMPLEVDSACNADATLNVV